MDIIKFLKVCYDDIRQAETRVLAVLPKIAAVVDEATHVAVPILTAIDPAVAPIVAAGDALFQQVVLHLEGAAVKNADGTVTLVVSAENVSLVEQIVADAKAWAKQAGF